MCGICFMCVGLEAHVINSGVYDGRVGWVGIPFIDILPGLGWAEWVSPFILIHERIFEWCFREAFSIGILRLYFSKLQPDGRILWADWGVA